MDHHFRAFSFVDRITAIEGGRRIRGHYAIPAGIDSFSPSLVGEAIGQIAAWAAMAAVDFTHRPVAGIVGGIDLTSTVRPGQRLELSADLDGVDTSAIAYSGTAQVEGSPVLRLERCVGPMVPVEEFDDPQALRERFALLSAAGAAPGAFGGMCPLIAHRGGGEPGRSVRATLELPATASFFSDHFPRRPVFPGSLLVDQNLQLVAALAAEIPPPDNGGRWVARRLTGLKLRSFIPPGETLEFEARLVERSAGSATVKVETRRGTRLTGTATILLGMEAYP